MSREVTSLIVIIAFLLGAPVGAVTTAASSESTADIIATLSEAHGQVFKRGFIDWEKETWGDPQAATVGDKLKEGMQLGTGAKSWAQVSWPNATTRAWANTVFAIAPNQRLVYLTSGEMLFNLNKNRKDKDEYFVWTKVLQARIRGTTLLVQSTPDFSRVTVLEGSIDVMNRIERSIVHIGPGVVYEVRNLHNGHTTTSTLKKAEGNVDPILKVTGSNTNQDLKKLISDSTQPANTSTTTTAINAGSKTSANENNATTTHGNDKNTATAHEHEPSTTTAHENANNTTTVGAAHEPPAVPNPAPPANTNSDTTSNQAGNSSDKPESKDIHDISSADLPVIPIFQTVNYATNIYTANVDVLLHNPLVESFDSQLESHDLVKISLGKLPPSTMPPHQNKNHTGTPPPTKLVTESTQIVRPPTNITYEIGPAVGTFLKLPLTPGVSAMPISVIGQESNPQSQSADANAKQSMQGMQSQLMQNYTFNTLPPNLGSTINNLSHPFTNIQPTPTYTPIYTPPPSYTPPSGGFSSTPNLPPSATNGPSH